MCVSAVADEAARTHPASCVSLWTRVRMTTPIAHPLCSAHLCLRKGSVVSGYAQGTHQALCSIGSCQRRVPEHQADWVHETHQRQQRALQCSKQHARCIHDGSIDTEVIL